MYSGDDFFHQGLPLHLGNISFCFFTLPPSAKFRFMAPLASALLLEEENNNDYTAKEQFRS